jgi:hypothetical protein
MDYLDAIEYAKMEKSCLYFIRQTWGLIPQPVKQEYKNRFALGLILRGKAWDKFCEGVKADWFEQYQDGLHITWQQSLICYGIDKALKGHASIRVSIVSGHGIGKSCLLSHLILWFLFVHPDSQVACTSPSKEQLYDVLWKELKKWIDKMTPAQSQMYVWESSHIRMKEDPQVWFARAKTSSKENTEALAGVHADWVLMAVDEASGVEEPIFETMEGALTSGNTLVFLISNGTKPYGYFYDSHHKDKERWQNFSFNSLESPRVDQKYIDNIVQKYGSDSVQYAIRVLGKFPDEGVMDASGYVQLFNERDLHFVPFDFGWQPMGRVAGALDASGEGQDKSVWAVRDRQRIGIVAEEDKSTPAGMAVKSVTICDKYSITPSDFVIDAFGSGMNVAQEIALVTSQQKRPWRVMPINSGEPCDDEADRELYVNKRAEAYYKLKMFFQRGGEVMEHPKIKDQLLSIRSRRTSSGRIQIQDKVQSKKLGFPSPDCADAMSYCMLVPDGTRTSLWGDATVPKKEFDEHDSTGLND